MDKMDPLLSIVSKPAAAIKTKDEQTELDSGMEELLRARKTFRDAVHGDIAVNELELAIIDTPEFQRLGKMKQLGPTNLVYRCATHTRFDHSLGVLCMAQRIIDSVEKNPFREVRLTKLQILLIRACGLLHDLVNIPFGHTLEDEGNLFPSQWKDKERTEHFLGDQSTIGARIIAVCTKRGIDGKDLLKQIVVLLTASRKEEIKTLAYPFISDIVNNTICADLLDYVARDMYFCGLRESYDERFLSYFYITSYEDKLRLVLRLIKPSTGSLRRDVLSETLHMLRLRYSLAEKVYYHHAKVKASAMIISAVNSALRNKVVSKEHFYDKGDEELLETTKKDEVGQYILKKLDARELYTPVYSLSYVEAKLGSETVKRRSQVVADFRIPARRYEAERVLEEMNFLKKGQVIVYCPGPEMGHKNVETLVEWEGGKGPLNEIPDSRLAEEIKKSIEEKHQELWNMYVFVDPKLDQETKANIANDCVRNIIKETNDEHSVLLSDDYLERYRARVEEEIKTAVSHDQMSAMRASALKYDKHRQYFGDILRYETFKELIQTPSSAPSSK